MAQRTWKVLDSNPVEHSFNLLKGRLKEATLQKKQRLKETAVKA